MKLPKNILKLWNIRIGFTHDYFCFQLSFCYFCPTLIKVIKQDSRQKHMHRYTDIYVVSFQANNSFLLVYVFIVHIFFFLQMKTLIMLFAIGLMSPLICEGSGLCMTACNSDSCEGGCKIKGYFSGMCSSDLRCPRGVVDQWFATVSNCWIPFDNKLW